MSGSFPEYYDVAKAALFWGIPPDDAINMPVYWIGVAANIQAGERAAAEKLKHLHKLTEGS